ncbi:MAG: hypothetical protein KC486_28680 [Myxococcales bacterium]|nr:hypothetical protein [Myxococcales bacterium]
MTLSAHRGSIGLVLAAGCALACGGPRDRPPLPWLDVAANPADARGPEGVFVFAGSVAAIDPLDVRGPGGYRVHVTPATAPAACQLAVQVGASPPARVGVDGEAIDRFDLYLDPTLALPFAAGDPLCGLIARRLEPPFFTITDAVIVDPGGDLLLAASASGDLAIPGWSFEPGGVAARARVDGGRATWRKVHVRHDSAEVVVGAGAWPTLEADGRRYRVMAESYRKRGTLVPEEAPAYRIHGVVRE